MNTRRNFIKQGFAVGAAFSISNLSGLFAAENDTAVKPDLKQKIITGPDGKPLLVAVRDAERETPTTDAQRVAMLEKALIAISAIEIAGGKPKVPLLSPFVKKGQTVLIKPNIGWDKSPELAANTHPALVGHLVKLALEAGAKEVNVFDHTCDRWENAYKNSGIEKAVKDAGGKMAPGHDEAQYREAEIPGAKQLKKALVHNLILDSDVFINVPVLKHHQGASITACMKNMMGVIWDRRFWHQNDLHQCIADFIRLRKPALNILDAYSPMMRNGPRGNSVTDLISDIKTLLVSTDIVAIDAAGAKILGHAQDGIPHVKIAGTAGLGTYDLDGIKIERIKMA